MQAFDFKAELWLWSSENAKASWYFVTLPKEVSQSLSFFPVAGFGSIRVEVSIGSSRWRTSVFPSKAQGSYILPIKACVRKQEKIGPGDCPPITLKVDGP